MDFYNRDLFLLENITDYLQRSYPNIYGDNEIINRFLKYKELNTKKTASTLNDKIIFTDTDKSNLEDLYVYFYGSSDGGTSIDSLASNYLTTVKIVKDLIQKSDNSINEVVTNIISLLSKNDTNDQSLNEYLNKILIPSIINLSTTDVNLDETKYYQNVQPMEQPIQQPIQQPNQVNITEDDLKKYIDKALAENIETSKKEEEAYQKAVNEKQIKQQKIEAQQEIKRIEKKNIEKKIDKKGEYTNIYIDVTTKINDPIYNDIINMYDITANNTRIDKNILYNNLTLRNLNNDIIMQILKFIEIHDIYNNLINSSDNPILDNKFRSFVESFNKMHNSLLSIYKKKPNASKLTIDDKFEIVRNVIAKREEFNEIIKSLDDISDIKSNQILNIQNLLDSINTNLEQYNTFKLNLQANLAKQTENNRQLATLKSQLNLFTTLITDDKHIDDKDKLDNEAKIDRKRAMLTKEINDLDISIKQQLIAINSIKLDYLNKFKAIKNDILSLIKQLKKIQDENKNSIKEINDLNIVNKLEDFKNDMEKDQTNIDEKFKSNLPNSSSTISSSNSSVSSTFSDIFDNIDTTITNIEIEKNNIYIQYVKKIQEFTRNILDILNKNIKDEKADVKKIENIKRTLNEKSNLSDTHKSLIDIYYNLQILRNKIKFENDNSTETLSQFNEYYSRFNTLNSLDIKAKYDKEMSGIRKGGGNFIEINEIYKIYYNNIDNKYINDLFEIFDENIIYILLLILNCCEEYDCNYINDNITIILEKIYKDLREQIINFYNTDILLVYYYNRDEIIYYNFINYIYENLLIIKSKSNKNIKIKIKNDLIILETDENYNDIYKTLISLLKNKEIIEKLIIYLKNNLGLTENLIIHPEKTQDTEYLLLFIYKYSKTDNNIILEGFDAFLTYIFLNTLNKLTNTIKINNINYDISKLPSLNLYNFCNLLNSKNILIKMTDKQAKTSFKLLNSMELLITIIYKKYKYLETLTRDFNPKYNFYINDNIIDFINILNNNNYEIFNNYNKIPIIDLYSLNKSTKIENNNDDILYLGTYNFKDYNEIPRDIYIKLIKKLLNNPKNNDFAYYMIYLMNDKINKNDLEKDMINELPNITTNDIKKFIYPNCEKKDINVINILKQNLKTNKNNKDYNLYIPYLTYYYSQDTNNRFQYEIQDLLCDNIISMINKYYPLNNTKYGGNSSSSSSSIIQNRFNNYIKNGQNIANSIYNNIKNKFIRPPPSNEKTIFDEMLEKYEKDYNNVNIPKDLTQNKFYFDVKNNKLDIAEELAITFEDKLIFIALIYIFRLITLYFCHKYIDSNKITDINKAIYYYIIIYYAVFIIFLFIINFDTFKLRIIFNYMNLHINTPGISVHLILIGFFIYLIYLLIKNILGIEKAPTQLGEYEKLKLKYKLDVLTLIIYIFCSVSTIFF